MELLRDSSATLKELAAGALWNLSMSLDNKATIAGWGAITPLLELVKCGNAAPKEKAAGVLWNLAFENEDNQDRIVAACGIEPLISLALEGSRIQQQNAVGTLGCLSRHLSYDMKFCIASNGGIKSLLTFVKGSTTDKMAHTGLVALWGLCAQSGDDVRIHTQIADGEAILTSLFHMGNSNIKYLAARMLVWLTDSVAELTELCCAMSEAELMCRHVLERLQTLLTQHATSASVEAILNQFLAFLTMNENNSMVVRLASVYAVANTLAGFHRAMDQLDVRGQGEVWRPQWELDRAAMKIQLFGCEVTQLVNDLNHPKEQRKALTLLVHETERNTDSYTPIELGIFRELIKIIAKFSKLEMLPTRKWFIAPYDVQVNGDVLSRGAFGTIYLGKFKNADVVIKYIEIDSDLVRSNFLREVEVWQEASRHPNIVPFFGACHVGNPCFMMCKYISGGSIPRYLSGYRKKGIARVWRTLLGVTHGLQHLHSHDIVHSDLKGDNILMDGDVAMISDFGMSFFTSEEPPKYDNLGAIRWRAPEFELRGEVSFASDVYSLGMCVVEALTGKLPWGDIPDVAVKWHLKNRKFLSRPQQLSDVEWALVCGMCHWNDFHLMRLREKSNSSLNKRRKQSAKHAFGESICN